MKYIYNLTYNKRQVYLVIDYNYGEPLSNSVLEMLKRDGGAGCDIKEADDNTVDKLFGDGTYLREAVCNNCSLASSPRLILNWCFVEDGSFDSEAVRIAENILRRIDLDAIYDRNELFESLPELVLGDKVVHS